MIKRSTPQKLVEAKTGLIVANNNHMNADAPFLNTLKVCFHVFNSLFVLSCILCFTDVRWIQA